MFQGRIKSVDINKTDKRVKIPYPGHVHSAEYQKKNITFFINLYDMRPPDFRVTSDKKK